MARHIVLLKAAIVFVEDIHYEEVYQAFNDIEVGGVWIRFFHMDEKILYFPINYYSHHWLAHFT